MSTEVARFCRRILGDGPVADELAAAALQEGRAPLEALAAAAQLCREQAGDAGFRPPEPAGAGPAPAERPGAALAAHVRAELEGAVARLPERQREVLALRDGLGRSYDDIALVMGVDPAAVVPLLARARLRLRAARRGGAGVPVERCAEVDRALRALCLLQDAEALAAEEADWLHVHLAGCTTCEMAHGAMLEASANYRAWPE